MPFDLHTLEVPDGGYGFSRKDRALIASGIGVANSAGGGAGTAVTVAVSGLKSLPSNFGVLVNPGQGGVMWSVASKTSTGFTITLTPLSTVTVASGTVDWFLFA